MKASVCVVGKIGVVLRSFFNSDCVLLSVNEECIVFVNLWCCLTLINTDLDVFPFLFILVLELYIMKNFTYDYIDGLTVHLKQMM